MSFKVGDQVQHKKLGLQGVIAYISHNDRYVVAWGRGPSYHGARMSTERLEDLCPDLPCEIPL